MAIVLAGVVPAPQPAPAPTPTPARVMPAPGIEQMPAVMIYPFDVQTGADTRMGTAIAQILAQEMADAGGLQVLAIPQGVARTQFLDHARGQRADFYISGYVTQIGDNASVVTQVVSVDSGVILFSQTAQVATVADVASQSLLARTQILAFVGRNTENVQTQPANTPQPTSTNGANVPISGISSIVNSVFKHKTVAHGPPPTAVKPPRGVIIAKVIPSGNVATTELSNAAREMYVALDKYYTTAMTGVTEPPAQAADAICGAHRDNTIASGQLQEAPDHKRVSVTFVLVIYTCFGAQLDREVGKGSSLKTAIDAAVTAYVAAHPDND